MMMDKQKLGQFMTTNFLHVLQNLYIPDNVDIIEPFVGEGHLLKFLKVIPKNINCFDIDPKIPIAIKQDTLKTIPDYKDKFVLTNPPYLSRNKNPDKSIYDKYNQNDLYKCFLSSLIESGCIGGIIIIPLNFWCSVRNQDVNLRKSFLNVFEIIHLNVFEEQVFDDTSYTVCSFQFEKRKSTNNVISCICYPSKRNLNIILCPENNYTIGGHIHSLQQSKDVIVQRATRNNTPNEGLTNIKLKCIDDNDKVGLYMVSDDDRFIDSSPNLSARSYATLIINPVLSLKKQKDLVVVFNKYMVENRKEYNSLFLTNYRENNRKRISFKLSFEIINYLLVSENIFENQD